MLRRLLLPAILGLSLQAQGTGPSYSAAGLVNGATDLPAPLAPNTWTTLYGTNLSWTTVSAGPQDMTDGQWPIKIPGAGVQILFAGGSPAHLSYVSPTQIKFLTPASHLPGESTLTVARDGVLGPTIAITFADVSPGLFQNDSIAVATHDDGSAVNNDSPAHPGEIVVLFGTGFGQTCVPLDSLSDGRIVTSTDLNGLSIQRRADLSVTLDDVPLDPDHILWAGLAQGYAGQYQIRLQLPDSVGPNPVIRVWIGDQGSAPDIKLAVIQPETVQPE